MSNKRQQGFVGVILTVLIVIAFFFAMLFVRFKTSDEVTSGIAYNTTNNAFISGNTYFSVRANEATVTTTENQSTYCLPGDSPYKELVNRAAADKRVKIQVNANKYFTVVSAPWVCPANVTVTEVKDE